MTLEDPPAPMASQFERPAFDIERPIN